VVYIAFVCLFLSRVNVLFEFILICVEVILVCGLSFLKKIYRYIFSKVLYALRVRTFLFQFLRFGYELGVGSVKE
jgi:hypothetical protein